MAEQDQDGSPVAKRRKLDNDSGASRTINTPLLSSEPQGASATDGKGLLKAISPPPARRLRSRTPIPSSPPRVDADAHGPHPKQTPAAATSEADSEPKHVRSPFQLTRIRDLAPHQNVDTVGLGDILGDPLIKECWNFNFLFDIDFVMQHFDADVKDLVQVKIVHGFWKRDDDRRINLMEAAEPYTNVELKTAYIPDPFGTHHSKMLVLFRHDEKVQVVVHTANMIERDWGNMTQAVWRSPLLPRKPIDIAPADRDLDTQAARIGSGERFKVDLLRYLAKYENRLKALTQQLADYDFSSIRAAFIASAPSRQKPATVKSATETSFGWLGLREILSTVPVVRNNDNQSSRPCVVAQVSSIATLGQTPTWLTHFKSVLSQHSPPPVTDVSNPVSKTGFPNAKGKSNEPGVELNIIFPTPDEIRTSLDGYASGGSIHTKIQSAAQQKQLGYLRPLLCHWKYSHGPSSPALRREAHRGPAAPHIKTYMRFSDDEKRSIDWAMLTSANLSKQAWGECENKKGEVWIQSYETGVVVWPALYTHGGRD
jgi:tyrosyl-DNA phosphodiesterase-1